MRYVFKVGGRRPSRAQLDLAASNIDYQFSYYDGLRRALYAYRPRDVTEQHALLGHLFLFGDLLEESRGVPKVLETTANEISLLIPEWLAFMLCNFTGAYPTAARTLRWIFESGIASTAAVLDRSLLIENSHSKKPLSSHQFREWLRDYDNQRVSLGRTKRDRILERIGLTATERATARETFETLCKFVHISSRHFSYIRVPDITMNLPNFNRISKLAYRTMDLVLYGMIHAIQAHWQVRSFLVGYEEVFEPRSFQAVRKTSFPLTRRIVMEIVH